MATHFKRALGPFDATMVVVGGIIGAGIFINPYIVAQRLPSSGWVLAAWAAGGAIALAGALAYAELGSLFPQAGGQYVYLRDAYHPLAGFLYGWALLLLIECGAIAAVAITFAEYALRLAGRGDASALPLAIAAIVVVSAINYLGVKPGSRVLNVFVVLKVAALAILIGAGFLIAPSTPEVGLDAGVRMGAAAGAGAPPDGSAAALPILFGAALIPILFSYGGWQNANYVAEEIADPRRNLPRSLLAGTLLVAAVYVLVNVVYLRALGLEGLAATRTPASDAAGRLLGPAGDRFIAAAIAVSTFGFLDLAVLAPTRVYYAMAADGLFFRGVARLHPRFRTPSLAIVLQAAWSIALALTGTYAALVDTVVFADWIFFGLTVASVLVFRRRLPLASRAPGGFRAPLYPVLPILFAIVSMGVVASVVASNPVRSAVGAALLLAGIPAFLYWSRRAPTPAEEAKGRGERE
ncbi:MAG TPA: amino acid permease [Gemmatimonadota bacterium]|jgi:APA family basic amino acid/polyamine antiporter|nr:amino acid permease [Gemmatimonadota bacterium]